MKKQKKDRNGRKSKKTGKSKKKKTLTEEQKKKNEEREKQKAEKKAEAEKQRAGERAAKKVYAEKVGESRKVGYNFRSHNPIPCQVAALDRRSWPRWPARFLMSDPVCFVPSSCTLDKRVCIGGGRSTTTQMNSKPVLGLGWFR